MLKNLVIFVISFFCVYVTQFFVPMGNFTGLIGNKSSVLAAVVITCMLYLNNYNVQNLKKMIAAIFAVASPILIYYLTQNRYNARNVQECFVFAVVSTGIIFLLKYFISRIKSTVLQKLGNIILVVIMFLLLTVVFSYWVYYILSGTLLTPDIILTLFQTNIGEVKAYFNQFLGFKGAAVIALILCGTGLFSVGIICDSNKIQMRELKFKSIFAILLTLTAMYMAIPYTYRAVPIKDWKGVKESLSSYRQYTELSKQHKNMKVLIKENTNASGGLYVMVIGESETRDHMSAYGYKRDTTPWLRSMINSKNMLVFNRAYSNHTHTVPVLTYALTEKNSYNNLKLEQAASLLDIAKAANFKTIWISNQLKHGAWDTPVAAIASSAEKEYWYNKNVGQTNDSSCFDEKLIEEFSTAEIGENVLVVFHLMGSHGSYKERYPASYSQFNGNKNKEVDTYDNSILYTDNVLKKLYEKLSEQPNFKAMVYFSDHGEDVDQNRGHEATKFSFTMARIPFFIMFSDSFMKERADSVAVLQKHKNSIFTNDLICNLMCDLMGIGTKQMLPDFDLASDKYDTNRAFKTLHGKKSIREDKALK